MGLPLGFQDRMGEGQAIQSLEVGHPAFATTTDDVHHTDGHASECRVFFSGAVADICSLFPPAEGISATGRRETNPVEASRCKFQCAAVFALADQR